MKVNRVIAAGILAASLLISVIFWILGVPFFIAFLVIPFIPFFGKQREVRKCPVCGWETTGSEGFCPFDATPLPGYEGRE